MNKKIKIVIISFFILFLAFIVSCLIMFILPKNIKDTQKKQQKAQMLLQQNLLDIANLSYNEYLKKYSDIIIYSNFNRPLENFINRENYEIVKEFIKNQKYEIKSDKYDLSTSNIQEIGTRYYLEIPIKDKILVVLGIYDLELKYIHWSYIENN